MKDKLNDILAYGIIGIFVIIVIIVIISICFVLQGAIIYWVGNFALNVFTIDYQLTLVQSIAAGMVLSIIGSFFKSSGSKK